MRLFHFVPPATLPAIVRGGLCRGLVALSPTVQVAAVWLTADRAALPPGRRFSAAALAALGFDPAEGLAGGAARIAVTVPGEDRRLVPWATLPSGHGWPRRREEWFLWRGDIPPAWLLPHPPPGPAWVPLARRPMAAMAELVRGAA